ncbi:plasmid replication protein RepC [Cereibacter sp. SYSU M97828]|nr:plasmid replication protein RepC [Cereibacter flavus]
MKHISMTPFGRHPMAAGHLERQSLAEAPCPAGAADKWAILRDVGTARRVFGVSDRDLIVLQGLLSFLPTADLAADMPTIVFPSNAKLAERVHGMPESTLRRHIAALVAAGLILRHDSPNGKRYARRDMSGQIARAFGFDLRPLLVRQPEIAAAARRVHEDAALLRDLREEVTLRLRDASRLLPKDAERCLALQRLLRRKLTLAQVQDLHRETEDIFARAAALVPPPARLSSGCDSQNERHIQDSNKPFPDSEKSAETIAVRTVVDNCPSVRDYSTEAITTWQQLVAIAALVCPMMGITHETWRHALRSMGSTTAAATVICILERFDQISRPGAYLRALAKKEGFSVIPMLGALGKLTAVNPA